MGRTPMPRCRGSCSSPSFALPLTLPHRLCFLPFPNIFVASPSTSSMGIFIHRRKGKSGLMHGTKTFLERSASLNQSRSLVLEEPHRMSPRRTLHWGGRDPVSRLRLKSLSTEGQPSELLPDLWTLKLCGGQRPLTALGHLRGRSTGAGGIPLAGFRPTACPERASCQNYSFSASRPPSFQGATGPSQLLDPREGAPLGQEGSA